MTKLNLQYFFVVAAISIFTIGCVQPIPVPQWNSTSEALEAEYNPYLIQGNSTLAGQAFLTQQNGGVVKAAGRTVTLDPSTSVGNEWWGKAGKTYVHRTLTPSSPNFHKARKTVIADADGKFKFSNLAPGKYYVCTEVTWEVGGYFPTQGGRVGQLVEIKDGQAAEVVLNQYPQ